MVVSSSSTSSSAAAAAAAATTTNCDRVMWRQKQTDTTRQGRLVRPVPISPMQFVTVNQHTGTETQPSSHHCQPSAAAHLMMHDDQSHAPTVSSNSTTKSLSTTHTVGTTTSTLPSTTTASSGRSLPIAIATSSSRPTKLERTPSEIQLCHEQALADYRDYCMYTRLIHGIARVQHRLQTDVELRYQNDEAIANIIKTRHGEPSYPHHDPVAAPLSPTGTVQDNNDNSSNTIMDSVFVLDM